MRRLALVVALLLVAACGEDQDPGLDIGTPTSEVKVDASVVVHVDPGDGSPARDASVRCQSGEAIGTGFLLDSAPAAAACTLLLTNDAAKSRLVDGPEPGRICTEIYGGPQVATVEGTIEGKSFKTTIDRTNGCNAADWELLTPLLGPP